MNIIASLAIFLNVSLEIGIPQMGWGYTFSAIGDKHNPNPWAACLKRDMDDEKDIIIAHRTLPCDTKVFIYSFKSGIGTVARVGDRGPYGKDKRGRYRGIVDMSPRLNKILKARGKSQVLLIPLDMGKRRPNIS